METKYTTLPPPLLASIPLGTKKKPFILLLNMMIVCLASFASFWMRKKKASCNSVEGSGGDFSVQLHHLAINKCAPPPPNGVGRVFWQTNRRGGQLLGGVQRHELEERQTTMGFTILYKKNTRKRLSQKIINYQTHKHTHVLKVAAPWVWKAGASSAMRTMVTHIARAGSSWECWQPPP